LVCAVVLELAPVELCELELLELELLELELLELELLELELLELELLELELLEPCEPLFVFEAGAFPLCAFPFCALAVCAFPFSVANCDGARDDWQPASMKIAANAAVAAIPADGSESLESIGACKDPFNDKDLHARLGTRIAPAFPETRKLTVLSFLTKDRLQRRGRTALRFGPV